MEFSTVSENVRDESAAKNRFESFKLGKGLPSTLAMGHPRHSHTRSHSRNASVSSISSASMSTSKSTSVNDLSSFSFPHNGASLSSSTSSSTPGPPSKRNSHHRRRSSVSTRHESAEMMGVTVPDLPPSTSEDNINLGEKDSIRRRALWALEGKPDVSFAKVEIPDLPSPDIEKLALDFPTKLSFSASSSTSYNNGLNSLMGNKRDSFKLLAASASSKDQLHTLVEEEEEEECETVLPEHSLPSPAASEKDLSQEVLIPVVPLVVKPTSSRPRPANLNLRPLSLTPDNLVTANPGLPTPSLTPSPRAGLKSLALAQITNLDEAQVNSTSRRRRSAVVSSTPFSQRPSLSVDTCDSPTPMSATEDKPARRSSISYKRSSHGTAINSAGLPTPEMTPTFNRRYSLSGSNASISSAPDGFFPDPPTQTRPLSTSEQHFLFKSHNALLARITDLERALSMRRTSSGGYSNSGSSRPVSVASNFSSSSDMCSNGEPSDEMLRLIADLKAERDELKRDVDGWRMRVGDVDKQVIVLTKRVDVERREAWVARSRVGLLEVEKNTLERRAVGVEEKLAVVESENAVLRNEKAELEEHNGVMKERVLQLEAELEKAILQLDEERELRRRREEAELDLLTTPTPESQIRSVFGYSRKRGLGFTSVDSESSATDVEVDLSEDAHNFGFPLKVVEEETEEDNEDDMMSDDDNGLAGYEDEEDSDLSFRSSSSFDSMDDFPRSNAQFRLDVPTTPTSPTSPISECSTTVVSRSVTPDIVASVFVSASPAPSVPINATHVPRRSLSKPWTFPRGVQASAPSVEQTPDDGVDRFFGCLEDLEDYDNNEDSAPGNLSTYTYETSKSLFASGFKYASDDDDMPFFLPNNVGSAISDERLPVVEEASEEEEREDDSDMFGMIGGIKITFTPAEEDDEEENDESQVQFSPVQKVDMPPVLPVFDFDEEVKQEDKKEKEENVVPFNFGRPVDEEKPAPIVPATMITPPSSIPRPKSPSTFCNLPSSIPRPNSRPSFSSSDIVISTPSKAPASQPVSPINYSSSAYVTPPTKRGGMSPSFIPQLSPSPLRKAVAEPKAPISTFIRQPQRKPLMSTNNNRNLNGHGIANGSNSMPQPVAIQNSPMNSRFSLRRSAHDPPATLNPQISPSEMKIVDLPHNTFRTPPRTHHSPTTNPSFSSLMSAPITSRLSLQSFTSLIPLSWSSRSTSTKIATSAVAALCLSSGTNTSSASTDVSIEAPVVEVPSKRGYVSREKQLEKLRCRLEKEGFMTNPINVSCKKCENTLVVF